MVRTVNRSTGYLGKLLFYPVPHYSRWGLWLQAAIVVLAYAAYRILVLAPGEAVAGLAVVAVIMTVRAEHFTRTEQVVWILVAFGLMWMETHAIHEDRDAHEAQQRRDAARQQAEFSATLSGFHELDFQNRANLAETVGRLERLLTTEKVVQALSRQNLDAIAGTGSIPCVVPQSHAIVDGKIPFALWNRGKNNLTGVEVRFLSNHEFLDPKSEMEKETISLGTIHPMWPRTLPGVHPELDSIEQAPIGHYQVQIWTQNGYYTEEINFRKGKYGLPWAYQYWLSKMELVDKPTHGMPKGSSYSDVLKDCQQLGWSDDLGDGKPRQR